MSTYADEAAFMQYRDEDEHEESSVAIPLFLRLKEAVFKVFFRLNVMKVPLALYYHVLLLLIETLQLLSLLLVTGSYSSFGPYQSVTPWNLGQISWLIDLCWIFRFDRYLKLSFFGLVLLLTGIAVMLLLVLGLGIALVWYQKHTTITGGMVKIVKVLITLLSDFLYIPILDSLVFALRCSISLNSQCLDLQQSSILVVVFCVEISAFLLITGLCSLLYYDACMYCGGKTAKPHPRFKLMRLGMYSAVIFTYYFVGDNSGSAIAYLLISLGCGLVLSFLYIQYIPYYHPKIMRVRLGSCIAFTCAAFCLLVGEFFQSADSSNSSVTMLFFFLTPCIIQITHLAVLRRGKNLSRRPLEKLRNVLEVEIKGRMLAVQLKTMQEKKGDVKEGEESGKKEKTQMMEELEKVYLEAFRKFPTSEWVYLWSGLIQLHLFSNYILAMLHCFKGISLANKLDSQYILYHFRHTSEAVYKAHMTDDAYDYVMYEKCLFAAQKNDETVTRAQFYFWTELENNSPRIQRLNSLACETSHMIGVAKSTYQQLIKLNTKSTKTLRMFGGFLTSLNNFSDVGQRYIQKAEMQDESLMKNVNANVLNSLNTPLSFFDSGSAILTITGEFENAGEITKVNEATTQIFGYLKAELEGRSLTILVPPPFTDRHDEFLLRFHEKGIRVVMDNPALILYFVHKQGYLLEARILIKIVPNDQLPPSIMCAIKVVTTNYEFLLLNEDFTIMGHSKNAESYIPMEGAKTGELNAQALILNFTEIQANKDPEMRIVASLANSDMQPKCLLKEFFVADLRCYILTVEGTIGKKLNEIGLDYSRPGSIKPTDTNSRQISILTDSSKVSISPRTNEAISTAVPIAKTDGSSLKEEKSSSEESGSEPEQGSHSESEDSKSTPMEENPEDQHSGSQSSESHSSNPGPENPQNESSIDASKSISSRSDSDHEDLDQEANDIHSAYSSSKSMNSSMASLAQFNKSIKALISYEFLRTKKHVWRFKFTLIFTVILLILTSALTFLVIGNSVSFNETLSHLVNEVGNMRLHAQSLAYYVRMVSLMDQEFLGSQNRSAYLQWMSEDTALMHELNIDLHTNAGLLSAADEYIYMNSHFPTWLLDSGHVQSQASDSFDAASALILQAYLVQAAGLESQLSLSNDSAFYVYRNGEGELMNMLNASAGFYVNSARNDLVQARVTAILLILVSVIVLLLCAGLAVIPAVLTLDASKREVWEIFLEMQPHVCRVMKGKCNERLQLLNESAHFEVEEIAQDEAIDDEKGTGGDGKHAKKSTSEQELKSDEKQDMRTRRNKERRVMAKDIRLRKIVIAKLSGFFVMSLVFFYLIYYTGFQAVGSELEEEPVTINWASRLRLLSRSVNFWTLETILENVTDLGFKVVVPSGQNVGSAYRAASQAIWELEYVENSLIFGNAEQGLSFSSIRSPVHDALLFSNGCVQPPDRSLSDCGIIGDNAMMQGLHSALDMYATTARTLLQQIMSIPFNSTAAARAFASSPSMLLLQAMDDRCLYDSLNTSVSMYEDDYIASQDQMKVWQRALICVYSVCSVAMFFLVYNPMIQKIGQDTKQAWSMCTLIPQEYQEEFKRLNMVIRERRDNFKWR